MNIFRPTKVKAASFERWLATMGIILAAVLALWVVKHYQIAEIWIRGAGWMGPVVSIALYALLSLTPIPSDPLTLLNGVLFGWTRGFYISWMGNNAAALVEYLVSRNIRDLAHFDQHSKKLPVWLTNWPADSPWFLILGRFVPGFGGKIVSIMAGMYEVPWWKYLWTAAVANMVGALLYLVGGWGFLHGLRHFLNWIARMRQIF